jgi:hypothetical protein
LQDGFLNYYLARSDVNTSLEIPLHVDECVQQAANSRAQFKDTFKRVAENNTK